MKILLVEDNDAIIMGLVFLLNQEGYGVETVKSAGRTRELLQKEEYDLVLLDIALPDGSGFDICSQIKEGSKTPIIFLTAKEDELDVVKGLDMGADDYIVKPFRNRELLSRIKSVLRRSGRASAKLRWSDLELDLETGKVFREGKEIQLTKLEYRILSSMMSCPGKLFTREEILADIWDVSGNFVNDNTLSVTMKRIREKLGDTQGQLIKTVRGMGYRLEG